MKVLLIRYTGTKIDAIMCVRNVVYLDLIMAKNLVEHLPLEVEVQPERVEELRDNFELGVGDGSDIERLFKCWESLSKDRQTQLLQFLAGMGRLV